MANEQRLDSYMVAHGLVTGRDKACEQIRAGAVTVNGTVVRKPAYRLVETDIVKCAADTGYVGRGGLKLERALSLCDPLPAGFVAMDVGASTGGFTECLLRHGAARVYAVDVGHDQLHPRLRADPRVTDLSGTDVRSDCLRLQIPSGTVELLTADVSFISLRGILPSVFPFLREDARLILLIKPQFEAGPADVGKGGIVRDQRVHCRVLRELCAFFEEQGCRLERLAASPITGGAGRQKGNIEYLAILRRGLEGAGCSLPDIRQLVADTFRRMA